MSSVLVPDTKTLHFSVHPIAYAQFQATVWECLCANTICTTQCMCKMCRLCKCGSDIYSAKKKKKDFFLFVFEVQVWNAAFANWEVLGNMCNKALV